MVSSDAFEMTSRRLFAAIEVIPTKTIHNLYSALKNELGEYPIKWMLPEYFHITLRFLGNTSPTLVDPVTEILARTASCFRPFEIQLHGLGIFGSRKAKVLWIGCKPSLELEKLCLKVNEEINKLGFEPNEIKITPHITLGRIKKSTPADVFLNTLAKHDVTFGYQIVREICLYESMLDKAGARYVILNRQELR